MLTRVFHGGSALVDGAIVACDVVVEGGVIAALGPAADSSPADRARAAERIDCTGLVVAPGFIDLQCNGAVGHDVTSDPASIRAISAALPRFGVTAWLPTVVTAPEHRRRAAIEELAGLRSTPASDAPVAEPVGLHFEGPMISPERLGAHDRRFVGAPDPDELHEWISSGTVALVTLAPEVPGALDVIERLATAGVAVSAGHTAMGPREFAAAREAGLSYVTHLFNAMAPFGHRAPGPIGSVLADSTIAAGLIADGLHVDPVAVKMAWNALGPSRLSLVSDAVGALGMPFGRVRVGAMEISHDATGVRTADGTLAGSALALDQAVRNLLAWTGCDLADALATVTTTPADLLGLTDRGRLAVGSRADLAILDQRAELVATVAAGATVFTA